MSKPLEKHWVAAKCVLRYLQGTIDFCVKHIHSSDVNLTGFSYSYWAGNLDDKRSITCYSFNVGSRLIAWSSTNQIIVSLSSAKEEY